MQRFLGSFQSVDKCYFRLVNGCLESHGPIIINTCPSEPVPILPRVSEVGNLYFRVLLCLPLGYTFWSSNENDTRTDAGGSKSGARVSIVQRLLGPESFSVAIYVFFGWEKIGVRFRRVGCYGKGRRNLHGSTANRPLTTKLAWNVICLFTPPLMLTGGPFREGGGLKLPVAVFSSPFPWVPPDLIVIQSSLFSPDVKYRN